MAIDVWMCPCNLAGMCTWVWAWCDLGLQEDWEWPWLWDGGRTFVWTRLRSQASYWAHTSDSGMCMQRCRRHSPPSPPSPPLFGPIGTSPRYEIWCTINLKSLFGHPPVIIAWASMCVCVHVTWLGCALGCGLGVALGCKRTGSGPGCGMV